MRENKYMKKDFIKWHNKKEQINNIKERPFFHEREIWYCYLGVNVGFEQDGSGKDFLRPIIIIRKFNNDIFWAVPLTRTKKINKYYFNFIFNKTNSTAILSQIKLIDAQRLSYLVGDMKESDFLVLKQKLKDLLP